MSTADYGPRAAEYHARVRHSLMQGSTLPGVKGIEARIRLAVEDQLIQAIAEELARRHKPADLVTGLAHALASSLATLAANLPAPSSGMSAAHLMGLMIGEIIANEVTDLLRRLEAKEPGTSSTRVVVADNGQLTELPSGPTS